MDWVVAACWLSMIVAGVNVVTADFRGCDQSVELELNSETFVQTLPGDSIACYSFKIQNEGDIVVNFALTQGLWAGSTGFYGFKPTDITTEQPYPTPDVNTWNAPDRMVIPADSPFHEPGEYHVTVYNMGAGMIIYTMGIYVGAASPPQPSEEDASAMSTIFDSCCNANPGEASNCQTWGSLRVRRGDDNPCAMPGVVCDADGHITQLVYIGDGALDSMGGDGCNFAALPFAKFVNLQKLMLRNNLLRGSINWTALATLASLTHVDLSFNFLSGDVGSPCELQRGPLKFLELTSNQFEGDVPHCLVTKPDMEVFRISDNYMSGSLPPFMPVTSQLKRLAVNKNPNIRGRIPDLSVLSKLKIFSASECNFNGTLPPLGQQPMPNLLQFDVSYNFFEGDVPFVWSNLPSLQSVVLSFNKNLRVEFPGAITSMSTLVELQLEECSFSGNLPTAWGSLTNLVVLSAAGNQLAGPLPSSLLALPRLQRLDLKANRLTGPLPAYLGTTGGTLAVLDLSQNSIWGPLPPSFCQLPGFSEQPLRNFLGQELSVRVDLENNPLEGNMADCFLQPLNRLTEIDLSGTSLTCPRNYDMVDNLNVQCTGPERQVPNGFTGKNRNSFDQSPDSDHRNSSTVVALATILGLLLGLGLAVGGFIMWRRSKSSQRRKGFVAFIGDDEHSHLAKDGRFVGVPASNRAQTLHA